MKLLSWIIWVGPNGAIGSEGWRQEGHDCERIDLAGFEDEGRNHKLRRQMSSRNWKSKEMDSPLSPLVRMHPC
jgi:hypothetical protein